MRRFIIFIVMVLLLATQAAPYLQAASEPRYVGGTLVQGAAPDPSDEFSYTVLSDVRGYFDLSGKIWWEIWSPKDCKGWILSSQSMTGKRSFTIPAYERISYVVNPKSTFFGYSSCTGLEIKSQ